MTAKSHDCEKLRPLLALRVTDDLMVDEATMIDQEVRECAHCRQTLDSLSEAVGVLREAGAESLAVENRPSLWDRIEPRLGPAGRMRRRPLSWLSTRYLAVACVALVAATTALESARGIREPRGAPIVDQNFGDRMGVAPVAIQPVGAGSNFEAMIQPGGREFGGVVFRELRPDSPFARQGFQVGDVIVVVDGRMIYTTRDLAEALGRQDLAGKFQVEFFRNGRLMHETFSLVAP